MDEVEAGTGTVGWDDGGAGKVKPVVTGEAVGGLIGFLFLLVGVVAVGTVPAELVELMGTAAVETLVIGVVCGVTPVPGVPSGISVAEGPAEAPWKLSGSLVRSWVWLGWFWLSRVG